MPCFCWIDDSEIDDEMKLIRDHVKEIVNICRSIHSKGDLYPKPDSGVSYPRSPVLDVHTLLDDLWNNKCSEKNEP